MTENKFTVDTTQNDTRIVRTGTVLDNSNAEEFSSLLMELYSAGARNIIIEMATLEFLSSAGIGSIIGTVELFRERGGDIMMTQLSDKIMKILEVLDIANYLTLCASTDDAIARCGD